MRLDKSTARMGIPTVRVSGVRKCTVAMISCVTCVAGRGRNWNGAVMFWQMLDRGPGWQSAGRVIFRFEESQRERDRSIATQSLGHNHRDNIIGTTSSGQHHWDNIIGDPGPSVRDCPRQQQQQRQARADEWASGRPYALDHPRMMTLDERSMGMQVLCLFHPTNASLCLPEYVEKKSQGGFTAVSVIEPGKYRCGEGSPRYVVPRQILRGRPVICHPPSHLVSLLPLSAFIVADHGQMLACLLEQWSPSLLDTVAVDGA